MIVNPSSTGVAGSVAHVSPAPSLYTTHSIPDCAAYIAWDARTASAVEACDVVLKALR